MTLCDMYQATVNARPVRNPVIHRMGILIRVLVPIAAAVAAAVAAGCAGTDEPGHVCAPAGSDQLGECVDGVCTNHGCRNLMQGFCTDSYSAFSGGAVDWDVERSVCEQHLGEWGECPSENSMLDVSILDGDGAKVRHYYAGAYCSADEALFYMGWEFEFKTDLMPTEICRDDHNVCAGAPVQEEIGCSYTRRGLNVCQAMIGGIHQARKDALGNYCTGFLHGVVLDKCPDGELASCNIQGPQDTDPASPHYQEFFYRAEDLLDAQDDCTSSGGEWLPAGG